jgi:hypothetical protein
MSVLVTARGFLESINPENGGCGDQSADANHRGHGEKDQNMGHRPLRMSLPLIGAPPGSP